MRGYPIKEWNTDDGFYSTYALAHILGWDFRTYLKFTNAICFKLARSINGYSSAALSISKHRRLIGGWLFVDVPTLNFFLDRFGWPSIEDAFSCLDHGIRPLDYLANTGVEDRIIIEDYRGKSRIFPEISHNILDCRQFSDRLFNKISENRKKCQISVKMFCRVAIKHRRIEIHTKRVDLPRIPIEMPIRTVAGARDCFRTVPMAWLDSQ